MAEKKQKKDRKGLYIFLGAIGGTAAVATIAAVSAFAAKKYLVEKPAEKKTETIDEWMKDYIAKNELRQAAIEKLESEIAELSKTEEDKKTNKAEIDKKTSTINNIKDDIEYTNTYIRKAYEKYYDETSKEIVPEKSVIENSAKQLKDDDKVAKENADHLEAIEKAKELVEKYTALNEGKEEKDKLYVELVKTLKASVEAAKDEKDSTEVKTKLSTDLKALEDAIKADEEKAAKTAEAEREKDINTIITDATPKA
ncbi:hypothetical protein [[Mycoplasma] anseris]|uniref:Uncharacterized protein n=1 Tax=[Mycoplasma] anseris TaxID=92400 RepID=A0A2Z4NDI9_9BACT|nr:hypothetical protein [[Mycoplasma] anseris]AWX69609.1 hypothetical protein DP065_02540 [[Mycoplasma] anseris]